MGSIPVGGTRFDIIEISYFNVHVDCYLEGGEMKFEIKNPVLRWLAGCGLLTGAIGVVGVIVWILSWFVNLMPGYYEILFSHGAGDLTSPFGQVLLGIFTVWVLAVVFIVLLGLIYLAKRLGDKHFTPSA